MPIVLRKKLNITLEENLLDKIKTYASSFEAEKNPKKFI